MVQPAKADALSPPSPAAQRLGLMTAPEGPDADDIQTITGSALHSDTIAQHIFLASDLSYFDDADILPSVTPASLVQPFILGHVDIFVPDIDASASLGMTDVTITDGNGQATAHFEQTFVDPNQGSGGEVG